MIEITNIEKSKPYNKFLNFYEMALEIGQENIEVINISSYNKTLNEVHSRFVNLKYIQSNKWTFFSNYNSLKSKDFTSHNQISVALYWPKINIQIRISATISQSDPLLSDKHFYKRELDKNALAISSYQSRKIESYRDVQKMYNSVLLDTNQKLNRPDYWGGYSFVPYCFEFWEGHEHRINKREAYKMEDGIWSKYYLQP